METQHILKMLKAMPEDINANMDTNQANVTKQEEILAKISARMDKHLNYIGCQAEMRSTLDEWLMGLKDGRNVTTACNEATETETDPGMMQSIEEYEEIPKGEAALMPVGEPRKLRRVCNLAAKRSRMGYERTRENCESRRKVSRREKLAWRERNLLRNIRTLETCGRQKEFAAARIRTTPCAKVTRRKGRSYEGPTVEQGRPKNRTRNEIARGTQIGRTLGRCQLMWQEGTNGTRNRDVKEQLLLGNERTRGIYRKSTEL
jgi:hypothetical protein